MSKEWRSSSDCFCSWRSSLIRRFRFFSILFEYCFTLSFMYICKFLISACERYKSALKIKLIICFLQLLNNHSILKLMILIKTLTLKHLTGCQQRFRYRHPVVSRHNLFFYFSKNLVSYVVIVSKPNKMAKRMRYNSPAAMLLMLKFMWYDCAQLHISSCHVTHVKAYVI